MKSMKWRNVTAAFFLGVSVLSPCGAAQPVSSWPEKPVTFVVPFANGGSTDLVMRRIADELGKELHTPMIVENKAGGGGQIGSSYIVRQKPDGYSLMIGTVSTHAMHPSVFKSLPYDIFKDFTPITLIGTIPDLIVVNHESPAHSLREFIELAKSKPDQISYASGGPGTSSHLGVEYFASEAGIKLNHIPYRGSGPALVDVLGGHVNMMLDVIMTSLEPVKAGKIRALAVTSLTRSPLLPDVPTVDESGIKGFEAIIWFGIFAPANMPKELQKHIADKIGTVLQRADIKEFLLKQGIETVPSGPEALARQMKSDYEKWKGVVQSSGFIPQ